ncbi:hypothetical protein HDU87_007524 [Geranomyces variabilis]|uniref:BHLH domain-containing protein n=1 Tax=Geranomyces variabilis TaxID=109894 RepID=A0AAD5TSG4_9FUNG|nr:hypothetical protein HDU87_007524 [Geranomyces variabilis]
MLPPPPQDVATPLADSQQQQLQQQQQQQQIFLQIYHQQQQLQQQTLQLTPQELLYAQQLFFQQHVAERETFPLQINRSPLQIKTNPQDHLARQRDVLSIRTGTAITPASVISASMGSYQVISPGASPQSGPQYLSQQQQQQLQATQLLYQQPAEDQPLPATRFSPSLQPQYQQSHYPSPHSEKRSPEISTSPPPLGKSLKSPRILPSRRGVTPPSKSYRSTGRTGRDAEVVAPDSGAQMDVSADYITPPHYPQGVEFTLDLLNSVDMPLASFSDLPSAYYSTSSSPQSPPPTPLQAYELNQTQDVSTEISSSLYAAATPMDFLCNPALVTAPPPPVPSTLYGDEDGEGSDEEERNEDDGADDAAGGGEGANDEDAKSRRARNPKTPHKVSEKRRRELFKTHFDELTALLPPIPDPPPPPPKPPRPVEPGKRKRTSKPPVPKPPNRIQMLHHAMDYVQRLEDDHQRALEEVGRLMALLQ